MLKERASLPADMRRSKTPVLKPPKVLDGNSVSYYRKESTNSLSKRAASGLKFNFKSILLPELLRILFWTCIGALAVSLLALIVAGLYFHHK